MESILDRVLWVCRHVYDAKVKLVFSAERSLENALISGFTRYCLFAASATVTYLKILAHYPEVDSIFRTPKGIRFEYSMRQSTRCDALRPDALNQLFEPKLPSMLPVSSIRDRGRFTLSCEFDKRSNSCCWMSQCLNRCLMKNPKTPGLHRQRQMEDSCASYE